ncbi:MAG: hypothetical protein AAB512_03425 [Patescibacteria group bacterium]
MVDSEPSLNIEAERLVPGEVLVFPQPAFLVGAAWAFAEISEHDPKMREAKMLRVLDVLTGEYGQILDAISAHVGQKRVVLAKNLLEPVLGLVMDISYLDFSLKDPVGFRSVRLLANSEKSNTWLRDVCAKYDDETFVNPALFGVENIDGVTFSGFAEGGRVLKVDKTLLVSECLWDRRKNDEGAARLLQRGYKMAPLPVPINKIRPVHADHSHIDSHAALIKDQNDNPQLLVAKSYLLQGGGTSKKARYAAETVGVPVVVVDDKEFPGLAFNLIQFADKSVIVTAGAESLAAKLRELVGSDNVCETGSAIRLLPVILGGSIRCLTNVIDKKVLEILSED